MTGDGIVRGEHDDGVERSYPPYVVHAGVVHPCGQVPTDHLGRTPDGIRAQVELALHNLERTLHRAGSDLAALLQLTVHLLDPADFAEYDATYRAYFGDRPLPPRTTVFVPFFRGTKRIELTATAAVVGRR